MPSARMYRTQHLLNVLVLLSVSGFSALSDAQAPAAAPAQVATALPPLFANLTMPLDVSRAKAGTRLQARLIAPWTGAGCELLLGELLEGHVSQVDHKSKTDKRSAMHLVFDSAECNRHRATPFKTTVIALLGPSGPGAPGGESNVALAPSLTDVPALTSGGNAGAPAIRSISSGFRSVEAASYINQYSAPNGRNLPKRWVVGMVIDVPMNLTVGSGAEGGSIVWARKTDARLEGQTTLILLPSP